VWSALKINYPDTSIMVVNFQHFAIMLAISMKALVITPDKDYTAHHRPEHVFVLQPEYTHDVAIRYPDDDDALAAGEEKDVPEAEFEALASSQVQRLM